MIRAAYTFSGALSADRSTPKTGARPQTEEQSQVAAEHLQQRIPGTPAYRQPDESTKYVNGNLYSIAVLSARLVERFGSVLSYWYRDIRPPQSNHDREVPCHIPLKAVVIDKAASKTRCRLVDTSPASLNASRLVRPRRRTARSFPRRDCRREIATQPDRGIQTLPLGRQLPGGNSRRHHSRHLAEDAVSVRVGRTPPLTMISIVPPFTTHRRRRRAQAFDGGS